MSDERAWEEPLPWLAPVEDEDEPRGISARRMFAALIVVLLAAVLVAGTFFWLGRRDVAVDGPPQLIKAPAGPYKVKPTDPGGLDISGESETAFETSAGEDKDSQLDLNKMPETPIAKPEQPKTIPSSEAKEPVAAEPKPAPATGGSGSVVQLGAFANQAQAERAWTALSGRFPSVAALNKMVIPFTGGIRLRAGAGSPAQAKQVCQTLKAAGENCFVAQ
ncbi:MAG: SPOR domain-containing protein [Sphingomonas sp.]|nr:SPOR domain-containing protein [Sphingomonas sp.]MBW0006760.1 SPOR domain-containing protein [Sphingomonas sp.]